MAQWLHMYTGKTHGSLVRERTELLQRAIATWNETGLGDRTSAMRKKLLRLANSLVAAIRKEKKALLDRTTLDRHSDYFKQKSMEIEQMRFADVDALLLEMGASAWRSEMIDEQ